MATEDASASLRIVEGTPVLRFERRIAHPPAKVWRAVTDPAEMAHWFPAAVETELRTGAAMRFTFPEDAPLDTVGEGEILEFDPPKVYAFRWNQSVLRFELLADGQGCLLVFTETLGGGWAGGLAAGRNAAGWDVCLDAMLARLTDQSYRQPTDWLGPMEHYIAKFGLDTGKVHETDEGYRIHFARDLVWKSVEDVWDLLTGRTAVGIGAAPPLPATNGYVPAGPVAAASPPRILTYHWLHDGEPAGLVRFEITHDPTLGTRIELSQTIPARLAEVRTTALAAWHTYLELFFAATHGDIRCPWPKDRTEALTRTYSEGLH